MPTKNARSEKLSALMRWVPAIAWMGVIFTVSSVPGSDLPGGYAVQGHFIEYTVLGAACFLALLPGRTALRAAMLAVLIASLYGVTDELHQFLVPGRTPDVVDWGVDTLGAALGAAAAALAVAARVARRRPSRSTGMSTD